MLTLAMYGVKDKNSIYVIRFFMCVLSILSSARLGPVLTVPIPPLAVVRHFLSVALSPGRGD